MATDENDHANDLYLEEMQRRREAGLCFDCGEPDGRSVSFTPGGWVRSRRRCGALVRV